MRWLPSRDTLSGPRNSTARVLVGCFAVAIENPRRMAGRRLMECVPGLAIVVYPGGDVRVVHDQILAFGSLVQAPPLADSTRDGSSIVRRRGLPHSRVPWPDNPPRVRYRVSGQPATGNLPPARSCLRTSHHPPSGRARRRRTTARPARARRSGGSAAGSRPPLGEPRGPWIFGSTRGDWRGCCANPCELHQRGTLDRRFSLWYEFYMLLPARLKALAVGAVPVLILIFVLSCQGLPAHSEEHGCQPVIAAAQGPSLTASLDAPVFVCPAVVTGPALSLLEWITSSLVPIARSLDSRSLLSPRAPPSFCV